MEYIVAGTLGALGVVLIAGVIAHRILKHFEQINKNARRDAMDIIHSLQQVMDAYKILRHTIEQRNGIQHKD